MRTVSAHFATLARSMKAASLNSFAFSTGGVIGMLGGLIGLGGAEFRLPVLIGLFHFRALDAIIVNKAVSLIVVAVALPFRASVVPFAQIADHWLVVANLLAGSLIGAWVGAGMVLRIASPALYRVIALLLALIAVVLLFGHAGGTGQPLFEGVLQQVAGVVAGFVIGVFASVLGVAGGELLIPTLILLFGCDVKLAGSLSLAVSLPTMLVGFARYSQDKSFAVLARNRGFLVAMGLGSVAGAFLGSLLLGIVRAEVLLPLLALLLAGSSVKIWQQGRSPAPAVRFPPPPSRSTLPADPTE